MFCCAEVHDTGYPSTRYSLKQLVDLPCLAATSHFPFASPFPLSLCDDQSHVNLLLLEIDMLSCRTVSVGTARRRRGSTVIVSFWQKRQLSGSSLCRCGGPTCITGTSRWWPEQSFPSSLRETRTGQWCPLENQDKSELCTGAVRHFKQCMM